MRHLGCRRKNCGSGAKREGLETLTACAAAPSPLVGEGKKAVQRMTALAALIKRDIRIALRVGGGALVGVLFFLTVVVLMPFAVGPDLALLARLGPAILWLRVRLASLLTLDRLFIAGHAGRSLDLIPLGRTPRA